MDPIVKELRFLDAIVEERMAGQKAGRGGYSIIVVEQTLLHSEDLSDEIEALNKEGRHIPVIVVQNIPSEGSLCTTLLDEADFLVQPETCVSVVSSYIAE